jgi:dipeptide transport system ATP-binding protein
VSALLIQAENLTRDYQVKTGMFGSQATLKAVAGVSFELRAGRTLAVVGESGCGKSTLARLITMIEPPTAGKLTIDGHELTGNIVEKQRLLRASVQIVFQDPYGSLNPRHKIGKILEEPLVINHRELSSAERQASARQMLERVGLRPEHYERYPHMFSGGQRQRIAIARALMLNPKVLVLDEPVSALDLSIQSQILNLLVDLQDQLGLAYIFISHDLSVVKHMADDVMVMYLGRPVEMGTTDNVFNHSRHPYTVALLSATPVADPNAKKKRIHLEGELPSPMNPPSGCAFHPRCQYASDRCIDERPDLSGQADHQFACFFPVESD